VFLHSLTIRNFRKLKNVGIIFDPGLNIIVGPNNVGKTAIVDALRSLLSSPEDPSPRFFEEDIYRPKGGITAGAIEFHYIFGGLNLDDEADFLSALVPDDKGELQAHVHARYFDPDKTTGRLRLKRWCGLHEENTLNAEMVEDLRGVYLPPLRDAALGLRPNRTSQLARLIHILADDDGKQSIDKALKELDSELKKHRPLVDIQAAISGRHNDMVGVQLAQALEVDLSGSDFKRFSSRLSLMVDAFEIEQNGLGFNNLIFMAVVLSELAKNQDSAYRGLIVEEPEAHLHPQLQAVLLRYLENVEAIKKDPQTTNDAEAPPEPAPAATPAANGENSDAQDSGEPTKELPVQVFVTSHSPNFASIAKLSSLVCLIETDEGATSFLPRCVVFGKGNHPMTTPSPEQKDIIHHALAPLSVIACAGSGKTFTAVRRVNQVRGLLLPGRGHVALISFSNVAVDVFGRSYFENIGEKRWNERHRVSIETFDGFITTNILRPHASRTMGCDCMPFLVTGGEAFLKNSQYQFWPSGQTFPAAIDDVEVQYKNGSPAFSCRVFTKTLEIPKGIKPTQKLGKLGAYTHALGRYWAYKTLKEQPKILTALSRRFPQVIVDEAQDIGSMQVALLDLLAGAGSEITLIGDPNQAIFEFCGADGAYLRSYPQRQDVVEKGLTINFRSVPRIVAAANSLAQRSDTADREEPSTDNGAYFLPYKKGDDGKLIAAFEKAVRAAGLDLAKSAVVCRATKKKLALRNLGQEFGQGATKMFVSATLARDLAGDYQEAFRNTVHAMVSLLDNAPRQFCASILDVGRFPEFRTIRKTLWEFTRDPANGLPSGSLKMDTQWYPKLVQRVRLILEELKDNHQLNALDNLSMRLKKTGLPAAPVSGPGTEKIAINAALRVETIHGVKGESLDAVLYLADKEHVKAMVSGTGTELGRIGYVALTRARDLFWLGVTKEDADIFREALVNHLFVERRHEQQLELAIEDEPAVPTL
jgi:UvrD/REP helicase N-terminal domain/AAA ATPase domain